MVTVLVAMVIIIIYAVITSLVITVIIAATAIVSTNDTVPVAARTNISIADTTITATFQLILLQLLDFRPHSDHCYHSCYFIC